MKKTAIVIAVLSGIAVSGTASAANSSATMKVEGTIVPAICNISLNGGTSATLSIGKINSASIGTTGIALEPQHVALNINCPGPAVVGFGVTDLGENAGSVQVNGTTSSKFFSLGKTKSGVNVGGYTVLLDSGRVDSRNIANFISTKNGENWVTLNSKPPVDGNDGTVYSWSAETGKRAPTVGLVHQVTLTVNPFINKLPQSDMSDKIEIKGEATYDLVYL